MECCSNYNKNEKYKKTKRSDEDKNKLVTRINKLIGQMNGIKKMSSGRLASKERKKLDTSEFGIPELREFPIHDAAHVRAAEAYFRYAPEEYKAQLARNILAKAHLLGVNKKVL